MTEYRSVRARATERGFTALAVRYESTPDSFGSVWARGVFTASLNRQLPPITFSHDWHEPIGRATSWRDTAAGPEITTRLDTHADVPTARRVHAQLQSGTLTDVSVGFSNATRRDPTRDERVRWPGVTEVITKADMDELAVVLIGAVEGAKVLAVRRAPTSRVDDIIARVRGGRATPVPSALDAQLDAALEDLNRRMREW